MNLKSLFSGWGKTVEADAEALAAESSKALTTVLALIPKLTPEHLAQVFAVINPLITAADPALAPEALAIEQGISTVAADANAAVAAANKLNSAVGS